MGKMFALTGTDHEFAFTVKSSPEKAIALREHYPCVQPAWHMNKTHWNMVAVDGSVDDSVLREWIDDSYNLVVNGLTRKLKEELQRL